MSLAAFLLVVVLKVDGNRLDSWSKLTLGWCLIRWHYRTNCQLGPIMSSLRRWMLVSWPQPSAALHASGTASWRCIQTSGSHLRLPLPIIERTGPRAEAKPNKCQLPIPHSISTHVSRLGIKVPHACSAFHPRLSSCRVPLQGSIGVTTVESSSPIPSRAV